jgi:predicted MFS family arabinose efflux permease
MKPTTDITSLREMKRQVLLLAIAQALFQTASVLVMTIGALAAANISGDPALATVPIAAMFLGTAVLMFPASAAMAKFGRRAGFVTGALLGTIGGVVGAAGIYVASLPLLSLGTFLVGAYQAFAQFYRFAASEVASDAFRPRAISLVLGGGIVAALLGPTLARFGGPLLETRYAGSFLILALLSLAAAGVLLAIRGNEKHALQPDVANGRPWAEIVTQPAYLVALFGAVTGYGVMILAMTATPIAMMHHHHELSTASTVIQFHVLGMFLPSFFTGSLIARFCTLRIMLTGLLLLTAHVFTTWTGTGFNSFALALVLLGVGWNFLFIGGTSLLTTTYTPGERSRAQATNDMTIFAVGIACSFGAGPLLQRFGWQTLNGMLLPWLFAAVLMLLWFAARERRAARDVAACS